MHIRPAKSGEGFEIQLPFGEPSTYRKQYYDHHLERAYYMTSLDPEAVEWLDRHTPGWTFHEHAAAAVLFLQTEEHCVEFKLRWA